MKKSLKECASFFRKNKEYIKIFETFKRKYLLKGKIEGRVLIKNPSKEERIAIQSLLSFKNFENENISFSIKDFQRGLKEAEFEVDNLTNLINEYYGEEIKTKKELSTIESENISNFFLELERRFIQDDENIEEEFIDRYLNIIKENYFDKGKLKSIENEINKLYYCGKAIYNRKKANDFIKIAFLGQKITNNPHYFDKGTPEGELLLKFLALYNDIKINSDLTKVEQDLEIYYTSKIDVNGISNYTTAYGIHLYNEDGENLAYKEFVKSNQMYNIPLEHLKYIVKATSDSKKVFIVENEMVFIEIYEYFKNIKNISLICTSGQLKISSLILLELLIKENYEIYYSGDLDPEGIGILYKIIQKSNNKIIPWRMDIETYSILNSEKNKTLISESRLKQLDSINDTRIEKLIEAIKKEKKACYQESFTNLLIEDIKKF